MTETRVEKNNRKKISPGRSIAGGEKKEQVRVQKKRDK